MKLRDQAYHAFLQHLLDGRLAPGAFVTQRELMALTGYPLGAIREMIPRLEADGLMQAIPQRGLQVASIDVRLVREAFQLREIVETAAVAQFALTAPDGVIAEHRAALDRIMGGAAKGITDALLADAQDVDWAFHDAVVAQMGNRLLTEVHRVNVIRIRVIMRDRTSLSPEVLPPAFGEHARVLAAVERRDPAGAVAALRAHLGSARQRALGLDVIEQNSRQPKPSRRRA
jgi:DNA-binding GntR family transcriptional regulator